MLQQRILSSSTASSSSTPVVCSGHQHKHNSRCSGRRPHRRFRVCTAANASQEQGTIPSGPPPYKYDGVLLTLCHRHCCMQSIHAHTHTHTHTHTQTRRHNTHTLTHRHTDTHAQAQTHIVGTESAIQPGASSQQQSAAQLTSLSPHTPQLQPSKQCIK